jgi:hypothetical protein
MRRPEAILVALIMGLVCLVLGPLPTSPLSSHRCNLRRSSSDRTGCSGRRPRGRPPRPTTRSGLLDLGSIQSKDSHLSSANSTGVLAKRMGLDRRICLPTQYHGVKLGGTQTVTITPEGIQQNQ